MPVELKLPEGSKITPERLTEITSTATEKNWTQEQATDYLTHEHETVGRVYKGLEDAKPKPPEKYEFKKPEGFLLGDDQLAYAEKVAKEKGWTQEQATDFLMNRNEAVGLDRKAQGEAWKVEQANWEKVIREDKEVGGATLKENAEHADRFLERYFPKEFKDLITTTGLKGNPDFFRGLVKAGKAMANDQKVEGKQSVVDTSGKTKAQKVFANSNMNP